MKQFPMKSASIQSTQLVEQQVLPSSRDNKAESLRNILNGYEEFTIDAQGIIISSNLEAVNITGYEEWEIIGKHFSLFYATDDQNRGQFQSDLKAAEEKQCVVIEGWRLKKKGIAFWANVKIEALFNSLKSLTGYRVILQDTTHRVYYQSKLRQLKGEYQSLFENSVIGILRCDPASGKILSYNHKAQEFLGRKGSGLNLRDLFYVENDYALFSEILLRDKKVTGFEFQHSKNQPEGRWFSIDGRYSWNEEFAELTILEVTNRKVQEVEVQRLKNELDKFIYHASHDLRSPLSSILGLINLIKIANPPQLIAEYNKLIHERVHHLDILLKDLATITFNNHSEPIYEKVNMHELTNGVASEFSYQNEKIKILLQVDENLVLSVDVIRFRTVLRNLISNGIKYYNPTVSEPYVSIGIELKPDSFVLKVSDNGVGMNDHQLMMIYSMFHRGHQSLSGSGLGLYIVKSMVDKLVGRIKVNSTVGLGTEFSVTLPIKAQS
jgi:PAS domain S-box-containing protein